MSIKVFQTNVNGKIEFTRCELEKLLNETYNEGYHAGENQTKGQYWTWAPNWGTLITNDSTINKITATTTSDCLNSAYETKTDAIKDSSKTSTIESKMANSGAISVNHNGAKAAITTSINNEPPRTYTTDLGKNPNFDAMAKAIEEIIYGHPKQSAHGELTDPFVSLAKELSGI